MSLRAFHIFFIAVSILLAFGFGVWARPFYVGMSLASFAVGGLLVAYLFWFLTKIKRVKKA
jgi:hypothetical protein